MKFNLKFCPPPPVVKMLLMLIIALIMACLSDIAFAGEWTKKADMLEESGNAQFSATVFDNEIYIFGGSNGGRVICQKYTPHTDTWTKLANMPHSRQACVSAEVNGKIYVFGDFLNEFPVDVYDPITNTWETRTDMPNASRGLAGIATLDNKIYFIGGYKESGQITFPDVDAYDTVTSKWEKKKPMPKARDSFRACVFNGNIYVFAGYVDGIGSTNDVWEYNPNNETWIQKSNMPTIRDGFTLSIIEGKIYCMGGANWKISQNGWSTYDIYDPLTDTWANTENMPVPLVYHESAVVNNRIYQIGGMPSFAHGNHLRTIWEYNPFPQPTTSVSPKESLIGTWGAVKSGN